MDDLARTLTNIFANMATQATNQALQADPGLQARLLSLEGRCVEIQCTAPVATWHLTVTGGEINTKQGKAQAPQVLVRGTALDLVSWLSPAHNPGHIDISGDDTLLLELLDILRDFNPDFATPLSRFVGTDIATTLVGTAEMGLKGLQTLIAGIGSSVQQQASDRFMQQEHLDSLLSGIDNLRLRVDRLAAKVTQHEHSRTHASGK